MKKSEHNFYITGIHIGNIHDITGRAVQILTDSDFIVCEKESEYRKLFGILNIPLKKCIVCSSKNEEEAIYLTLELLAKGETGALISDCGVPLFEDPGFKLVETIRKKGFSITSVPGANSLITSISLCPFKIKDFYFRGFISRDKDDREGDVKKLTKRTEAIVIMESPHRLINILELLERYFPKRRIFLPINLTMNNEFKLFGTATDLLNEVKRAGITKGEFLIIIQGI